MALTPVASGTLTVTANTETNFESARAPSVATTYVFQVDLAALASGEVAFIRAYSVVLASGTEREAYFGSYIAGSDVDPLTYTVPIPVDNGSGITIRGSVQIKNWSTNRAIPWKLFSL